jgi:hypothetical protein
VFTRWRTEWKQRRQAAAFVAVLRQEPADEDVQWVASEATNGDVDRARWEVRYARLSLGLLASERDALDDLTPSLVASEITNALHSDPRVAANMVKIADQQFNERLSAYRHAFTDRTATSSVTDRLGDMFLRLADAPPPNADARSRASAMVGRMLDEANTALRESFGTVALPPDIAPSKLTNR